jgi:hypothetical protein
MQRLGDIAVLLAAIFLTIAQLGIRALRPDSRFSKERDGVPQPR